ncbi:MAG: DegT/DnrJ/EryC1/StrS family aminotransferase [Mariniblastus sp.]
MWARKRIDIGFMDLMFAFWRCISTPARKVSAPSLASMPATQKCLVCLSVRSGFDLLLSSQDWPKDSEIIFTGLTIPDMPRIARQHGFRPVGVDLDISKLEPAMDEIQRLVTPQTKAIVIAHLMGGRVPTTEIARIAKQQNLFLIEDFAQSYRGQLFSSGDASMFSFGTIKTNTALGGAIMFIADPKLRERMINRHNQWPQQSTIRYAKRILKYSLVKLISTRLSASIIRRTCWFLPSQHDSIAAGMAKSFSGGDFFKKIRHRPSTPLSRTLALRISNFRPQTIDCRIRRGKLLLETIREKNPRIKILGDEIEQATFWIFGILVQNPRKLTEILWQHGFDATRQSSLQAVQSLGDEKLPLSEVQAHPVPSGKTTQQNQTELPNIDFILSHLVFLPVDLPIPESEIVRMGELVARHAIPTSLVLDEFSR